MIQNIPFTFLLSLFAPHKMNFCPPARRRRSNHLLLGRAGKHVGGVKIQIEGALLFPPFSPRRNKHRAQSIASSHCHCQRTLHQLDPVSSRLCLCLYIFQFVFVLQLWPSHHRIVLYQLNHTQYQQGKKPVHFLVVCQMFATSLTLTRSLMIFLHVHVNVLSFPCGNTLSL